jgi:hypothetical protein
MGGLARFLSRRQPGNRPPAYVVGAGNVSEGLAKLVAPGNRLALLVQGQLRFPAISDTPKNPGMPPLEKRGDQRAY